ncbi:PREDICTED: uncharacterized protein LOC109227585 [Nicotiana attenuata]|uniref:uncharacterized protein LOC109227585 n=1 Tax=Nicotiana attenuata TaxID=49451 RepID=UPI000905379B|nr:PREDICTED: uncharacterized protein LOC109227585 [Nicotiana attenuata]
MLYGVNIISVIAQLIHCELHHRGTGRTLHATVIYAFNDVALRRDLWQAIKDIHVQMKGPRAIMGDFNCVLYKEERMGSPITMAEIRDFKKYVEDCSLMDLKFTRAFFTWTNKQSGGDRVLSRIDRVMVNNEWGLNLPASVVNYRNEGLFNHYPVIISWDKGSQPKNKMFRYFNMWSLAPDFKEKLKSGWRTDRKGTKMYELVGKLHKIKHTLQELNKDRFTEVERKADEAMQKLQNFQERMQRDPCNIQLIEEEAILSEQCKKWNNAREQFLRKKCKIQWLTQGDMNTKFFHSMMKARRNSNRIFSIDNADGQHTNDLEGIAKAFITFYESLLGTNQRDRECHTLFLQPH